MIIKCGISVAHKCIAVSLPNRFDWWFWFPHHPNMWAGFTHETKILIARMRQEITRDVIVITVHCVQNCHDRNLMIHSQQTNNCLFRTMLSIACSSCLSFLPQLSNQRGELTRQKCHQTDIIMMGKDGRFPPLTNSERWLATVSMYMLYF